MLGLDSLKLFPSGASGQSLYLRVPYPDSQETTEEAITLPVEDHLSDLEGLKAFVAVHVPVHASINLEFHRSIPMNAAYNAVVDHMERALLDLPEEAQEYMILNGMLMMHRSYGWALEWRERKKKNTICSSM